MIRQGGNHLVLKVVTVTRNLDPDDTARKKGACPREGWGRAGLGALGVSPTPPSGIQASWEEEKAARGVRGLLEPAHGTVVASGKGCAQQPGPGRSPDQLSISHCDGSRQHAACAHERGAVHWSQCPQSWLAPP